MPNIESAKKRVVVSAKKSLVNKNNKSALKTEIKNYAAKLEAKPEEAQASYNSIAKEIDKAAAKGVLHKNTAAHKKSAMAKKANAASKAE